MSIKTGDLPVALDGEPIDVVGTQGNHTVRASLPPAARHPVATIRDMDDGTSNTTQVTPAGLFPYVQEMRTQFHPFWVQDADDVDVNVQTLAGSGVTGYLIHATGNILTGDHSFRNSDPLSATRLFTASNQGIPAVAGDTLRIGIVFGTSGRSLTEQNTPTGRICACYWQNHGALYHKRVGAGTQNDPYRWARVEDDDPLFINYVYSTPRLRGWFPLTQTAKTFQGMAANVGLALSVRGTRHIHTYALAPVSATIYAFSARQYLFRAPASDITAAQVRQALETLSGNNRLDAQYIKNLAAGEEGNGVPNNNSVSTIKIQDSAVTAAKIADGTITTDKLSTTGAVSGQIIRNVNGTWVASNETAIDSIGDATINTNALADSAVNNSKLADDAVTSSKIADNAVTEDRIKDNAVTKSKIADNSVSIAEIDPTGGSVNQVLGITSGGNPGWVNPASVATVPDDSISTGKIIADAVTQSKMADNSVGSGQLIDGSVAGNHLQNTAVGANKIANRAVSIQHFNPAGEANQVLTMSSDGNSVAWRDAQAAVNTIGDGSITSAKIADNAIDTSKLASGSVTATRLANGGVTTAKIASDAVTNAKIADNAVGPEHINVSGQVDGAVLTVSGSTATWQTAALADNEVVTAKIANGAVTQTKIATGAVTGNRIANGAVDTTQLANDAVETAKIKDANVTLAKISLTGGSANQVLKINAAGTGLEFAAESSQATGVLIVNSKAELDAAETALSLGSQIRIGVAEIRVPEHNITMLRGAVFRRADNDLGWDSLTPTINAGLIPTNTIEPRHIRANAVETAKIRDGAVTNGKIADDAVTSSKIADGSITSAHMTDAAVRATQMDPTGLTDGQLVGRVGGNIVGVDTITTENIATGGVNGEALLRTGTGHAWGSIYPLNPTSGDVLTFDGANIVWVGRPTFENMGGASGNVTRNGTVDVDLAATYAFSNYHMIHIWGRDKLIHATVPIEVWALTTSSNGVRLHDNITVYRKTDSSYTIAANNNASDVGNYRIAGIYGQRWS